MDHRRDQNNSGNKVCRYFKEGTCFYMNEEQGGCWYLHSQSKAQPHIEPSDHFNCSYCENLFKTKSDVMQHRLKQHEDEVPICNSVKEGKRCSKNLRCWFRHPKPSSLVNNSNVLPQSAQSNENISTKDNQGFWPDLTKTKPPNQMEKMMDMLMQVISEVSQLKQQISIQK